MNMKMNIKFVINIKVFINVQIFINIKVFATCPTCTWTRAHAVL